MREVSPGDIIFSFVDTAIPAIGVAQSYCWESPNCWESPKPTEFGPAGEYWEEVRVKFTPLLHAFTPRIGRDWVRECYAARLQPCPFCYIAPSRILLETEQAVAFLEAHPISKGHTLVAPRQHVSSIHHLSSEEQKALWGFVGDVRQRLQRDFRLGSFYIGFNDRPAAGKAVTHAHIHIIPRRQGDVPDPRAGIRWAVAESA